MSESVSVRAKIEFSMNIDIKELDDYASQHREHIVLTKALTSTAADKEFSLLLDGHRKKDHIEGLISPNFSTSLPSQIAFRDTASNLGLANRIAEALNDITEASIYGTKEEEQSARELVCSLASELAQTIITDKANVSSYEPPKAICSASYPPLPQRPIDFINKGIELVESGNLREFADDLDIWNNGIHLFMDMDIPFTTDFDEVMLDITKEEERALRPKLLKWLARCEALCLSSSPSSGGSPC